MADIKQFFTSKKGITFLALFTTLLLGITIGTLVSDRVLSAEEDREPVALLKVQAEGSPLVLDENVSSTKGDPSAIFSARKTVEFMNSFIS